MLKKIIAYIMDEEGQTSTEYILLLVVAAMLVFKFKDVAEQKLIALTNKIFTKANNMVDRIK